MYLANPQSVRTQHKIGSDIVMVLDDVVHSCTVDPERFVEATARTVRWLDRCIAAHKSPEDPVHCGPQHQNLFGIVQGGLDVSEVSIMSSKWLALARQPDSSFGLPVREYIYDVCPGSRAPCL
jgi:tRNA-guanine family transglycosylase